MYGIFENSVGEQHEIRINSRNDNGELIAPDWQFKLGYDGYNLRTENDNGSILSPLVASTLTFQLVVESQEDIDNVLALLNATTYRTTVEVIKDGSVSWIGVLDVEGFIFPDDTFPTFVEMFAVDGVAALKETMMDDSFFGGELGKPKTGTISVGEFFDGIANWFYVNISERYINKAAVQWNWTNSDMSDEARNLELPPYEEVFFDTRIFNKYVDGKIEFMTAEEAIMKMMHTFGCRLFTNGDVVHIQQVDTLAGDDVPMFIDGGKLTYDFLLEEGRITKHTGGRREFTRNSSRYEYVNGFAYHNGYFRQSNEATKVFDDNGDELTGMIWNPYTKLPWKAYSTRVDGTTAKSTTDWDTRYSIRLYSNNPKSDINDPVANGYLPNNYLNDSVFTSKDTIHTQAQILNNFLQQIDGKSGVYGDARMQYSVLAGLADTTVSPEPNSKGLINNQNGNIDHRLKVKFTVKNNSASGLNLVWVGLGIFASDVSKSHYYAYSRIPINFSTSASSEGTTEYGVYYIADADLSSEAEDWQILTEELGSGTINFNDMPEGRWVEYPSYQREDDAAGLTSSISLDMNDCNYVIPVVCPFGQEKEVEVEIPITYIKAGGLERLDLEEGIMHVGIGQCKSIQSNDTVLSQRHFSYLIAGYQSQSPSNFDPFAPSQTRNNILGTNIYFSEIDLYSAPNDGFSEDSEYQRSVILRDSLHSDELVSTSDEASDVVTIEGLLGTPLMRPRNYTDSSGNNQQELVPIITTGIPLKSDGKPMTASWSCNFFDTGSDSENWKSPNSGAGSGYAKCFGVFISSGAVDENNLYDINPMSLSATACAIRQSLGGKSVNIGQEGYENNTAYVERRTLVCTASDLFFFRSVGCHLIVELDNIRYAVHSWSYDCTKGIYTIEMTKIAFSDSYVKYAEKDVNSEFFFEKEIYD